MPNTREKLIELLSHSPSLDALYGYPSYVESAEWLIEQGVTVQKWIPVTERLPERNTEVLVCDTREDYVSIWGYIGDELWFGEEITWATEDITHWMPLPEAPKGE